MGLDDFLQFRASHISECWREFEHFTKLRRYLSDIDYFEYHSMVRKWAFYDQPQ